MRRKKYKNLRADFSKAIGTKVYLEYVRRQAASMSLEEHQKEAERYTAEQEAWK